MVVGGQTGVFYQTKTYDYEKVHVNDEYLPDDRLSVNGSRSSDARLIQSQSLKQQKRYLCDQTKCTFRLQSGRTSNEEG